MIWKMLPCKVQQVMELGHELHSAKAMCWSAYPDTDVFLMHLIDAARRGHIKCIKYEIERNSDAVKFILNSGLIYRALKDLQVDTVKFIVGLIENHPYTIKRDTGELKIYAAGHYSEWFARMAMLNQKECKEKKEIISFLMKMGMWR